MGRIRHRVTSRVAVAVAAPLAVLALSGCEAINTASETVDKAKICTDALAAAGFNPDLGNPQKSVDEAQQKAEELRNLAGQTTDATLQRELNEMADTVGQLKLSDVNPANSVAWADQKLQQLQQLNAACAGG
jgi:hypothetical protein